MRILLVHNHYQSSSPSGEDVAFDNERHLLTSAGHEVVCYTRHNDDISASLPDRIAATTSLFWSRRTYRELTALIRKHQPDLAHFHNTFPLISASGYAACRDNAIPIIQTLHNYRLICPGALLLRDGKPCEKCVGNMMLPAVKHGCYRDSSMATALTTAMLNINRSRGVYSDWVDRYISLTPLARDRLIRGGLPADKIVIKPNVLRDPPEVGDGSGGYALYVGRLTREKGIHTLIDAWARVDYPLLVAGEGPLRSSLEQRRNESKSNIQFLGFKKRDDIMLLMQNATMLIIPSECYEGFPVTVLEGLAAGTPLLVSALGALDELVQAPEHCYKFKAGDANDLSNVATALLSDSSRLQAMRLANRSLFDRRYSLSQSISNLEKIYHDVIARRNGQKHISTAYTLENRA